MTNQTTLGLIAQIAEHDTNERKKRFGELLQRLRKNAGYTRAKLAERSNVSARTILDIEHGEKAVLDRHTVYQLCEAFTLNEFDRQNFLITAGFDASIDPSSMDIWRFSIQLYENTLFPAFILDSMWRLHSINSYFLALCDFSATNLDNLYHGDVGGPHLLRVLFDPHFAIREWAGEMWHDFVLLNCKLFRLNVTSRFREDISYQQIISKLKKLPDFTDIWQQAESLHILPPPPYFLKTHTSKFGPATFMMTTLFVPPALVGRITVALHTPADGDSTTVFDQIRSAVPKTAWLFGNNKVQRASRLL